ncbi:MAG: S41 family peptidase [Bacteroidia bacterium]|nr:S41 family peptidase [Bacteroidia bacterium]
MLPVFSQKILSLEKIQEDFDYLVANLEEKHQGIKLHLSPKDFSRKVDSLRAELSPMSRPDFFKHINALLYLTHEGHTEARLPGKTLLQMGTKPVFFPLSIRIFNKKAYLSQYYDKEQIAPIKGAELLSINGRKIEEIMEEVLPYIPTDGFNWTSAYEWLSWQFPLYYRLVFGPEEEFEIRFKARKSEKIQSINLAPIKATQLKSKNAYWDIPVLRHKAFDFEIIEDSIAYLAVNGFSREAEAYAKRLKAHFQTIKEQKIKHLIIDIQYNGGGTEGHENLLMSYLSPQAFQKYAFVSTYPEFFEKHIGKKVRAFDQWKMEKNRALRGDFSLQSDYYSDQGFTKPEKDLIYEGKVYALIGGVTFSGGAEFASMLKMTERAIFIGEETGGAYEGNVSGYSTEIKLPHSRIKISIPAVHFRLNVEPEEKSRGVMPDYEVQQTIKDYLDRKNSKKEYVLSKLIHPK